MPALADLRRRPLLGVAGAVAVALLTVTGCSAGQDAQTVQQTSVVDGTGFQAGAVSLRDVGLRAPGGASYAVGSTAYLEGLMVNENSNTDQLVSVSSPVATSVVLYADGVVAVLGDAPSPTGSPSGTVTGGVTGSASPSDTSSPSGSPSDSSSASGSASASATAAASGSGSPAPSGSSSSGAAAVPSPLSTIMLPTNQSIQFGYSNQQLAIVFRGLTKQLFPAQSFPVTFTFAKAGSVTATIAVKLPVGRSLDAPTVDTEPSAGGE